MAFDSVPLRLLIHACHSPHHALVPGCIVSGGGEARIRGRWRVSELGLVVGYLGKQTCHVLWTGSDELSMKRLLRKKWDELVRQELPT